jgi:hypothetical protein
LESQRVKCLIEGHLRGWLNFNYELNTSRLREELILNYIEDERLYALLQNRLLIETTLRAGVESRDKKFLEPIYDVSRSMIGLKLPLALPKDTIKKDSAGISKEELQEWKEFLEKAKTADTTKK